MSTESVPKGLKVLVIAMGVVLVGGFLAVTGIIAQRLTQSNREASPSASAIKEAPPPCAAQGFALPAGYEIERYEWAPDGAVNLTLSGPYLRFLVLDPCTGRIISDLTFRPAEASATSGFGT